MGFAEVIKYGAIIDDELFGFLEQNYKAALSHDAVVMEEIISVSAAAKCDIVSKDENESGDRKKLNFGHTFAHAFEKLGGIPHGEAVGIGMVLAAKLSEQMGMLPGTDLERLKDLLEKYKLPLSYQGSCREVFEVMKRDKKRGGDSISLILLEAIGKAVIHDVEMKDLKNWIDDLC